MRRATWQCMRPDCTQSVTANCPHESHRDGRHDSREMGGPDPVILRILPAHCFQHCPDTYTNATRNES